MAAKAFYVSRTETEGQPSGAATLNRADAPQLLKIVPVDSSTGNPDPATPVDKMIYATDEDDQEILFTSDTVQSGDLNPVTSDAVYNAVEEAKEEAERTVNSYSEVETWTGGYWIDGKPIYRKCGVYNNGGSIGTGEIVIDSTLTMSYVDSIVATGGSAKPTDETILLSIGGYSGDLYRLNLAVSNAGLVKLSSDVTYINFKWWIEYTKTTD